MGIKSVLATLIVGTVFAMQENYIYIPLVKLESSYIEEKGQKQESECVTKGYTDELFLNISNRLDYNEYLNGTKIVTKDDIANLKEQLIGEISTIIKEQFNIHQNAKYYPNPTGYATKEDIEELNERLNNMSTITMKQHNTKPRDCKGVQNEGNRITGIHTIYPNQSEKGILVRCDMDTSNGGWTVIQRRISDSDFYKTWDEYEAGFGNLSGNFWLGNRNIHLITSQGKYELRVDLTSMDGETAYAEYDAFSIGDAESYYKLTVDDYSGTSGDSLTIHNGMKFSTYDRDNDESGQSCAKDYLGAWWYYACHKSNLNGDYGNTAWAKGPVWHTWKGFNSPMKTTEMKVRRIKK